MRIAYADPPYVGCARSHYGSDPQCAEVNHRLLVAYLADNFDGWALSLHSPSLVDILPLCPREARVGAWVKTFAIFKPNVNPAYAWEPVIFKPARNRGRASPTFRDWVAAPVTINRGVKGAKPEAFSWWLFSALGAEAGDEFEDVFPGSGAVSRAWLHFSQQMPLDFSALSRGARLGVLEPAGALFGVAPGSEDF